MRVDTEVLYEAGSRRTAVCRKLEEYADSLGRMAAELGEAGDERLQAAVRELKKALEEDVVLLRATGTALHNIATIYDDAEQLIADHSDGAGFIYKDRSTAHFNDLRPLKSSYNRVVRGENLVTGGSDEQD